MNAFAPRRRFPLFRPAVRCVLLAAAACLPVGMRAQEGGSAGKTTPRLEAPAAAPPPGTLRWNNGESIGGETVRATATSLTWKSPLFEDPLLLGWNALHRIDWTPPDDTPAGPFSFALRDGSHLYGDLAGVTAETVSIHSARHGDATLRRAEVLSARRLKGNQLLFAGPWGESGWAPAPGSRSHERGATAPAALGNVPTRLTGPGGVLVLPYWRRAFLLGLPLPDRLDVEFRLHAKERPDFTLVLDSGAKERLSIASWQDDLVVTAANEFQQIRPFEAREHEVALRVCWDRPARRCQIYTPEGSLLKEWTAPAEKGGAHAGVLLENLGTELTLDFLRVRAWDGQPLPATEPGHPRVEFDDGRVLAGSVSGLENGVVTIPAQGEGPPAAFALDDVDALIFSTAAPRVDPAATVVTYADGTILRGELAGIEDGRATLQTSFASAPLPSATTALRQMRVRVPAPAGSDEPALETLDKIVVRETALHGHLVATSGETRPRWLPVGGEGPVLPVRTLPSEITRAVAPGAEPPPATTLFYTRSGDVLPGVLHGLDRTEMEFESPLVETGKLPTDEVRAIQFNASTQGTIEGFTGRGWQVLRGPAAELRKTGDVLNLTPDSALGNPWVMRSKEIRFNYDAVTYGSLRLRMFCDGTNPARALNYILFRSGNRMITGVEETEGQFFNQNQTRVKAAGPVAVRLVIDEKGVRCYFNNALAETVPFSVAKRAGSGLIIEPAGMWGNPASEVTLSKFSAAAAPGQIFFPDAHPDARAQALIIPRFRKDDPPRHALLAANGDLLRGEIEAITNTQLGFRVGLDMLRVPRDRVQSVIMLQPPSDDPPPPEENAAARKLLDRSMNQRIWYSDMKQLVNAMQRVVPELKFKLPPKLPDQETQQRLTGQTVGDMLASACERFDLRYRIEGDAVIIEEKSPAAGTDLISKVYWLKPDARPKKGSARDVLAARGISFPNGAGADWQDSARQLTMTNTAANQQKLADLLAGEFGGTLGSPDCWLRLTDGGGLGMAVERFGPDAVTGTHPLYGRCTVPLSMVYTIRNTPPAPAAAGSALNDWRLAYAPEPVLPESGGQSSALLGKDAPAFKLAMLDGGSFELGKEKGNVVVLDFWATWCGPCVKSLPGLIETMTQFPTDRVKFVGIDQAEAPAQVKRFLETRGWKLAVALDAGQNVARQYGVDGIPQTVIIGPDGKVAWTNTGYDPEAGTQAAEAVKKLLATAAAAPSAAMP